MKLLNIGCGNSYHPDWINLDLYKSKFVKYYNIKNELPFADNSIDVVYHSHVLEHVDKSLAKKFINDCYRILKPKGIIRIVVPDLEKICFEYLKNLKKGFNYNDQKTILNYQWNKLELFDQIIRSKKGGEMLTVIENGNFNEDYILSRNGEDIKYLLNLKDSRSKNVSLKIKNKIINLLRKENFFNKFIVNFIKKANPKKSGEIHKWIYNKLDLKILLENSGFKNFKIMKYNKSRILNWNRYALDKARNENRPRKPDSLFVEAIK